MSENTKCEDIEEEEYSAGDRVNQYNHVGKQSCIVY